MFVISLSCHQPASGREVYCPLSVLHLSVLAFAPCNVTLPNYLLLSSN